MIHRKILTFSGAHIFTIEKNEKLIKSIIDLVKEIATGISSN